jgi:hypothetical protein
LIKYHYLQTFALHQTPLPIDETFVENVFKVIQSEKQVTRERKKSKECDDNKDAKKPKQKLQIHPFATFESIKQSYDELYNNCIKSDESISHILNYCIQNFVTLYQTNINEHYTKYVKRMVYKTFMDKEIIKPLKKKERSELQTELHSLVNALLYEENQTIQEKYLEWVKTYLPWLPLQGESLWTKLENESWTCLREMVLMTKYLETKEEKVSYKLLSPFIITRSCIPGHIRIDTSGLAQLFMNKKELELFRDFYFSNTGVLLKPLSKANMLSKYEELSNNPKATEKERLQYASSLWLFLCKFTNKRYKEALYHVEKGTEWVFNNTIQTDGFSISFSMVPKQFASRKTSIQKAIERRKALKETPIIEPFEKFDKNIHSKMLQDKDTKLFSVDPGKGNLITVHDGKHVMTISSGFKESECKRKHLSKIRNKETPKEVTKFHTEVLSKTSSKSVKGDKFKEYIDCLESKRKLLHTTYRKPIFRNLKFTSHCLEKRFDDKLLEKLETYIIKSSEQEKDYRWLHKDRNCENNSWNFRGNEGDRETRYTIISNADQECINCKNAVFLYGNWGRRPNLKNSSPTPGIGLKRKIARRFKVLEVCERLTSKTCPCCLTKTLEPYNKVHQLLRCKNVECSSRWWSRDVAGSMNILYKTLRTVVTPVLGEGESQGS